MSPFGRHHDQRHEHSLSLQPKVKVVEGVPRPDPGDDAFKLATDARSAHLSYEACVADGGGRVTLDFQSVRAIYCGWPNDEALSGHRLYNDGLEAAAVHEAEPSDWVADLEYRNRVHPAHNASLFESLRHWIITFKDDTFECVFKDVSMHHVKGASHESP